MGLSSCRCNFAEYRRHQAGNSDCDAGIDKRGEQAGAAGSQGDVQRFTMQEVIGDEFFTDVQYDVAQLTEYTGGDDAGGCNFIFGFTYYTTGSVSHQKFESKGKRRTGNKLRNGEVIHHRTDAGRESSGNRTERKTSQKAESICNVYTGNITADCQWNGERNIVGNKDDSTHHTDKGNFAGGKFVVAADFSAAKHSCTGKNKGTYNVEQDILSGKCVCPKEHGCKDESCNGKLPDGFVLLGGLFIVFCLVHNNTSLFSTRYATAAL